MSTDATIIANKIVQHLELAWNAGDGGLFSEVFTDDAEFVSVRGDYEHSRAAIAGMHQGVLETIYKESVITIKLAQAKFLTPDVILAHCRAVLSIPAGFLAGDHIGVESMVLVSQGGEWKVASLHNTLQAGS